MPSMFAAVKRRAGPLLAFACLAVIAVPKARAFGANEHRVVGYIAAAEMCASTRTALADLDRERDVAAAGTWADEIRGDPRWDVAKRWHYVNVGDQQDLADLVFLQTRPISILWAIDRYAEVLADAQAPPGKRVEAYRFLVHFIADVHQPLHVGRADDRGGNSIKVVASGGRRLNLHRYWDGNISGLRADDDPRAFAGELQAAISAAERALWRRSAPLDWAEESKQYRPDVYAFPAPAAGQRAVLDDAYAEKAISIISLRLSQAGVRLAAALDQVFCTPPRAAVTVEAAEFGR